MAKRNKREIMQTSIRLLPKNKKMFIEKHFYKLIDAIQHGIRFYKSGFQLYRQNIYESHETLNTLIVDVKNIKDEA